MEYLSVMILFAFMVRGVCFPVLCFLMPLQIGPHLQNQPLIMNLSSLCMQPSVLRNTLACESKQLFAPACLQACSIFLSSVVYRKVSGPLGDVTGGDTDKRCGGKCES